MKRTLASLIFTRSLSRAASAPPPEDVSKSIQELDWERMARDSSLWQSDLWEDEGMWEGPLPNEWANNDKWLRDLETSGAIPNRESPGPKAKAYPEVLKQVEKEEQKQIFKDAATVAKAVITNRELNEGSQVWRQQEDKTGEEKTLLSLLDKLETGHSTFTDEEQRLVAKLQSFESAQGQRAATL
eukprot:NODE_1823_length_746_cov_432.179340_g1419_i0.p1 GENE.NODE_1823_length_746_cov_432.179340_g1419_i0~~NODE_1823_length_746_cov_432.179340_g1419_i0.p1  ORF type:complete len:185 (-),score=25.81 NODE_1823_length_746_cov_432.179340_g1419_i0:120-674(-)